MYDNPGGYPFVMKLAIGDLVVYGTHGIGRVTARKKQLMLGTRQDVVVLELEDGLTVTLALERAQEQLRPLAGDAEMKEVQKTLRHDRELSTDPWLSRRREVLEKLTGGHPIQLAEIVSEGAQRERVRAEKNAKSPLSAGERELFVKARKLLSGEIALALGIQQPAAEGWIDEQLEKQR